MRNLRSLTWMLVLTLVAVVAAACGPKPESGGTAPKDGKAATTTQPAASPSESKPKAKEDAKESGPTVTVTIVQGEYKPAELTVKKGTKVVWENTDTDNHDVTFNEGLTDKSPVLPPGAGKWSLVMNKTGEFSYICGIHPFMQGKVKVTD